MLRPLVLFHPGIGVSGSYLGITARFRNGDPKNYGHGPPPNDRPESPEGVVYLCGAGEHCAGLGTCLKEREQPPQLVVPSHDRRRLLIPGVRWGVSLHGVVSAKQNFAVLLSIVLGLSRWNPTG